MKWLCLLLLIPFNSLAQKKGDNIIILHNTNYKAIKSVLFQNNYIVENDDTSYINTASRQIPKTAAIVKLMFQITDTAVYLKGLLKPIITLVKGDYDFMPVNFRGAKGSQMRDSWNELNRIALILSKEVVYKKQ